MTKYTFMACVLAMSGLALGGCSDDSLVGVAAGHGTLDPTVALDGNVKAPRQSRSEASRAGLPSASELSLRLVSADGSYSKEWETVGDFSTDEQFEVGTYTLEAWHGTEGAEGFECPYYYGSCQVVIEDGKNTTVALTAALAQAQVDVTYTDGFKSYLSDFSAKVNGHDYAEDETRPLHLTPGWVSVTVSFTKPDGKQGVDVEVAKFQAKAQTLYRVNVDIEGGVGGTGITVTYDDDMDSHEVTVDISDEVMDAPAPVLSAVGFEPATAIEFVKGMAWSDRLQMNVMAQAGLKEVRLVTTGSLLDQGWPADIDLLTATAAEQATLQSLGLSALGVFNNPDKAAVLNFGEVLGHITAAGENTFSLTATDKFSRTSEPLVLTALCEDLVLAISGADTYEPGQPLTITVDYNGMDIANNVTFSYFNDRGTWTDIDDVTISAASRATTTYSVTLGGLPAEDQVTLRATCGGSSSNSFVAKGAPYYVTVNDYDAYAKHAYAVMAATAEETRTTAELNAAATYYISTDGGSTWTEATATKSGDYADLTGLASGTSYLVKVRIDGINSKATAFTTESELQVPNPGMEDWYASYEPSGINYYYIYWVGTSNDNATWGTNNPMTTSEGSGYAYCRSSGTIPDDGGATSKAALLRTIGWGSGNTALGSKGSSGKTKYIDAGLLHLGSSRSARPNGVTGVSGTLKTEDLTCGIAFASRPSSISFKYKYSPKNSADKGLAEYWIKDASDNVLASGSLTLDAASEYTTKTFAPAWSKGTAKGAKLYIKFLSTNSTDFLTKTDANLSGPGLANLSWGMYLGSQLYIDDITLTY